MCSIFVEYGRQLCPCCWHYKTSFIRNKWFVNDLSFPLSSSILHIIVQKYLFFFILSWWTSHFSTLCSIYFFPKGAIRDFHQCQIQYIVNVCEALVVLFHLWWWCCYTLPLSLDIECFLSFYLQSPTSRAHMLNLCFHCYKKREATACLHC